MNVDIGMNVEEVNECEEIYIESESRKLWSFKLKIIYSSYSLSPRQTNS